MLRLWVLAAVLSVCFRCASGAADLCSQNLISSNTTYMQFTKEPIPYEYGFHGKFKSIHCCVKGYRSIEWFKDGIPYPWPAGLSNLILYPEAGNQTLYVRRASRSDSGDYACRITNQTQMQEHHIKLQIFTKVTNAPRTMYVTGDQSVEEGGSLRLFCEALIERTHLADAISDLKWKRLFPNETEGDLLPTQKEINTSREDVPDIYGSYLLVEHMSPADYGRFVCVVHSNNVAARSYVTVSPPRHTENPPTTLGYDIWTAGSEGSWHVQAVPWRGLAMTAALLACVAFVAAMAQPRCMQRLRWLALHARALVTTPAQRARVLDKEFDVLVCWTPVDGELVRGVFLTTLQGKYKYRVNAIEVPAQPDNWCEELHAECYRCRALVAIVSPTQYTPQQLVQCLRQLRALPLSPICVLLQDLPDMQREAKESGETLMEILRHTRLIPWRDIHDCVFWTQLRLALPIPPPPPPSPSTPPHVVAVNAAIAPADDMPSPSGSLAALVA